MESINSDERYFEGLLTVQMKDKQGEITIVDELYKVLPIWMDRGAPISDTHSNRIIGKGINYSKTIVKNEDGDDLAAIKITGKIFKNYELDNVIWNKIKNKEYQGLSFGGATRSNRTPMKMKDGSMAYALSNLEHYEVAVCKDPAVPMAVITDYNPIAKATFNTDMRDDGKMIIRCTQMGCFVEKSDDVNKDSLIKIEDEDDKNTEVEVLDEWKNDDNDSGEESKKKSDRSDKWDKREKELKNIESRLRGGNDDDVKPKGKWDRHEGYGGDKNFNSFKADLNESQTFEQKVQALIKEGKSRESAEKIVGSFVHKKVTHEEQNVGVRAEQPYAAARTGEEIMEAARNARKKITLDADMKKAGYQTEAGNDQLGGQGATEDDKDKREKEDEEKENDELKRRDHSDSDGDMTSAYNQNVGREASSGRKTKAKGDYCPNCGKHKKLGVAENGRDMGDMTSLGGACPNCGHGFKPKEKADTTANQVGGIRGGNDVAIQGSGETNDINIVQPRPERFEDKGAANIKIAIYTKKVKSIKYNLEKHSQIQEIKKIKDSLPKKEKRTDFPEEGGSAEREDSAWFHRRFPDAPAPPSGALRSLGRKKAQIQELNKIKNDLGDARGCTEHQHQ